MATEPVARPSSAAPSNSSGGSSGGGGGGSGGGAGGNSSSSAAAQAAAQAAAVAARVAAAAAAGIQGLGVPGIALGPVTNEDIKVPDKMVGLSEYLVIYCMLKFKNTFGKKRKRSLNYKYMCSLIYYIICQ